MQHALPDHPTGILLEGRYELGARIARGGTASVYRAEDTRLQRVVAVKLLHPHLAEDPAAAERFVREARAAARLSHPHVVSVLDQGHAPDGVPYLVMEHVQGATLRDLLRRRGRLTPREALDVMESVLDGLAAAHRAGLVHRDVKPENVLIADTGRVTVADFGLTRAVDEHTATGTVLGTVGYASPELVTGRPVDTRADVYSAGIVLFELLTGRRPFTGSPVAVARAHADGRVPGLRALDPGAPAGPARLLARATAREPERRPADAGRMLEELRAVRAGMHPAELDRLPGQDPSRTGPFRPAPTEGLRPGTATTEALRADGTRALTADPRRPPARRVPLAPPAAARRGGSTDPWRPEIELRASRPLRTAGILALGGLAVAAAAFLGWLIGTGPGGAAGVPDVRGTGPELARQHLAGAGLENVAVHETSDPLAPSGTVIGTAPGASSTVHPAEQVVLLVSIGPERTAAPDVTGMTEQDAGVRLTGAGLVAGTRTAVFDGAAPGTVVGQSPDAGTAVDTGSAVEPVVSRGARVDTPPGVVGRRVAEAVEALAAAGFPARVEETLGAPFGRVVAQRTDGTEVVLTVL